MCNILFKEVLRAVSEETDISDEAIASKSRRADVVDARQMVVWFSFKVGMRPKTIAEKLGISRQAVSRLIQTISAKRLLKSFDFIFVRVAKKLQEKSK